MIILGIDPGYANCGLAVVEKNSDGKYVVLQTVSAGLGPRKSEGERIDVIAEALLKIFKRHRISAVGFERNFFGRNKSSAFKIAQVVGVLKYLCHKNSKSFYEFLPNDIKGSVGTADKSKLAMASAVQTITGRSFSTSHETDAVAVALTYFFNLKETV